MAVAHRVYAEALLAAAGEKGRLAEVREDIADFAAAVESSEELRSFLRNPQIEPHVKRDALAALLADADELVRNFLLLLAEKGRIAEIEEIHSEFERLIAQQARVLELELTTAVDLSDEEASQLVRRIEDAAGRRVEATRRVDPDIIGGIVVQAGSRRLDASVRGRLNRLRQELTARR
ncbi:MAG TPA: ATP synthase F1 subunit delta [Gaiellaceae bacterium]|nr:ATP synthase F1 subunit delta [Gaiellaceae bacterium]